MEEQILILGVSPEVAYQIGFSKPEEEIKAQLEAADKTHSVAKAEFNKKFTNLADRCSKLQIQAIDWSRDAEKCLLDDCEAVKTRKPRGVNKGIATAIPEMAPFANSIGDQLWKKFEDAAEACLQANPDQNLDYSALPLRNPLDLALCMDSIAEQLIVFCRLHGLSPSKTSQNAQNVAKEAERAIENQFGYPNPEKDLGYQVTKYKIYPREIVRLLKGFQKLTENVSDAEAACTEMEKSCAQDPHLKKVRDDYFKAAGELVALDFEHDRRKQYATSYRAQYGEVPPPRSQLPPQERSSSRRPPSLALTLSGLAVITLMCVGVYRLWRSRLAPRG